MKKSGLLLAQFAAAILLATQICAAESYWNLPSEITDRNAFIEFSVGTTWHTVHGKTSGITGQAKLSDIKDYKSISASLAIPVAQFDTDSSSRDSELRDDMEAGKYPEIKIAIEGAQEICNPQLLGATGQSCAATLKANLTIRNITKELSLPCTVTKDGKHFKVEGKVIFNWPQFGIIDPSILIAKVHDDVTVAYSLLL